MKIVYTNDEGGVSVLQPVKKYMDTLPGTEEEKMLYIADKNLPEGIEYAIVENVDPFDATEAEIKAEAEKRIFNFASIEKQLNAATRAAELLDIWRENGKWTDQEKLEHTAFRASKAWIDSVRAASNAIELDPPKIDKLENDSRWPNPL